MRRAWSVHGKVLNMRILAVDDEFVALSKLVTLLEPLGQCDAFTSGYQALNQFRKVLAEGESYDLLLIDINLQDANGLDLLARFQKIEREFQVGSARKVIVTAESTSSNVAAAVAGRCDGFLVKPVRRAVLMEKLAALQLVPFEAVLKAEPSGAAH
jgi:two-component system, chemotaxis family, chemotaxis protein CheY